MLGSGGVGSRWIRNVWQTFRDQMELARLVDPNPAALREAGDWLGLPPAARFADAREAFATVDAHFCCIVTPPEHPRRQSSWRVTAGWTSSPRSRSPTPWKRAARSPER